MNAPSSTPVYLTAPDITQFGAALLVHGGASAIDARVVMEHLVTSSAMGLHSHGVMRIPQYLAEMQSGVINAVALPTVSTVAPARLAIDGQRGFGQVVGMLMVDALASPTRANGIAMINGRHLGHTGRIGAYPEALANLGLIGIAVCNGAPSGHWVAPFGGSDGRVSTNPIAFAWPVDGSAPVVADFSTATAPEGVVRVMRDRGLEAPGGYLRDAAGHLTRDPNVLYAVPKGAIQPMGGDLGYRATALALLVEVLTTILNDDAVNDSTRKGTDMTLIAIAPQSGFGGLARDLSSHIRASPPLDPARPVLMPGDRENAAAAATKKIRLDGPSWTALIAAANAANIALPTPVAGEI
jgi:uncharacterized oxidoreductase